MKEKLEKIDWLLEESIKKVGMGMPFTAQTDVKEAQRLIREVLAEEFPDKYSRDSW